MGYSVFTLFFDEELYPYFLMEQKRFTQFTEITAHYKVTEPKLDADFHFVMLTVMDYQKTKEEICKFVLDNFSFLAMHQEDSQFIFIEKEADFRDALLDLYKDKTRGVYFFYDMLSVKERYWTLFNTGTRLNNKEDLQLLHRESITNNTYQLNLDEHTRFLFQEESEIDIVNRDNGEVYCIDAILGLDMYKFKIAILGEKKLERRH